MTSFFPFSSSSTSLASPSQSTGPEPHLEINIQPSSSAFYTGEPFRASIRFSNTRRRPIATLGPRSSFQIDTADVVSATRPAPPSGSARSGEEGELPRRRGLVGLSVPDHDDGGSEEGTAEAGPSRPHQRRRVTPGSYAPQEGGVTDEAPRNEGDEQDEDLEEAGGKEVLSTPQATRPRSPKKGRPPAVRTSQNGIEGRRSLEGGMSPQEMVWALGGGKNPPPLPSRRIPGSSHIPSSHPHSRKISITTQITSPTESTDRLSSTSDLHTIPEHPSDPPLDPAIVRQPRLSSSSFTSAASSSLSLNDPSGAGNQNQNPGRSVVSPPPTHPYIRSLPPSGEITILWAYTRLVAHFHPSNHFIPPDPFLPLRSLLLHQPIGSGSLSPTSPGAGSSRWQLSFGTGTIGNEARPSLTGSLVGLASSLVYGGQAGSLEEERKRVWNAKDLPVFETARSLLGVEMKLKEGETRDFSYELKVPRELPPSHRGRAYKFAWSVVLSLGMKVGKGEQRLKEVEMPIRVWDHVALGLSPPSYDVLKPIIQTKDEAKTTDKRNTTDSTRVNGNPARPQHLVGISENRDTLPSLRSYARHLLHDVETTRSSSRSRPVPMSPSSRPSSRVPSEIDSSPPKTRLLGLPNGHGTMSGNRARKGSFIQGDDELVEDGRGGGCASAVDILSRQSNKASYDIAKDGLPVSTFTLLKTTFRLGEPILGILEFNNPSTARPVLKTSAFLETHDLIPTPLLPLSPRGGRSSHPQLVRVHSDFRAGYVVHSERLSFRLDIPPDMTPSFRFSASPSPSPSPSSANRDRDGESLREGDEKIEQGGVEWKVRLAFLIAVPPKNGEIQGNMTTLGKEGDNRFYTSSGSLAPLGSVSAVRTDGTRMGQGSGKDGQDGIGGDLGEVETETVECEIPIRVLPGQVGVGQSATYTV